MCAPPIPDTSPMFRFDRPTPTVRLALIAIGAVFVAQLVVAASMSFDAMRYDAVVTRWLAVDARHVLGGEVWTLLTYALLHDLNGWGHILINALMLWLLGTQLEHMVGRVRMRWLLVGGALAGGVGVVAADVLVAAVSDRAIGGPVVGASAMVTALVAGFCWMLRDRWLQLFVLRLKGWHMLLLLVLLDVALSLRSGHTSLAAHAGGYLWGLLWASGWTPRRAWLRLTLWRQRRHLKVLRGGVDDAPTLHRGMA